MREIKFRAFDKINNKMWQVVRLDFSSTRIIVVDENNKIDDIHKQNLELMQYTGLKDKNGKEIYEGDVITIDWGEYNPDKLPTMVVMEFRNYGWYPFTRALPTPDCVEVIGNIHENPELLKTA